MTNPFKKKAHVHSWTKWFLTNPSAMYYEHGWPVYEIARYCVVCKAEEHEKLLPLWTFAEQTFHHVIPAKSISISDWIDDEDKKRQWTNQD